MNISQYLRQEWRPALGCTEPASIAYAAAVASAQASGEVEEVRLICDARIYKNCYAVGIPHSNRRTGIRWALAIGGCLPDPSAKLECFKLIDEEILEEAEALIDEGKVVVEVDTTKEELFVDCAVRRSGGRGRAVIENEHTRLVLVEADGVPRETSGEAETSSSGSLRKELVELSCDDLIALAKTLTDEDRAELRRGARMNLTIAEHGLTLFPKSFAEPEGADLQSRLGKLVCAGVYARMAGEDFSVMSLVGSGNKGITCSVPLFVWGTEAGVDKKIVDEALALACLFTSCTTFHLGTLSAVCGCSNAAGIGLAAGLVYAQGGGSDQISLAINNMVGNVAGMICDGAKIGCALKTMTAVDAAFRSASLAMSGLGIPATDGIVGTEGMSSLKNMGRIATLGMISMDKEILEIMREKLK